MRHRLARVGRASLLVTACCAGLLVPARSAEAYSPERAGFSLSVLGELVPYRVFALYVMPGQRLTLQTDGAPRREIIVTSTGVEAQRATSGRWAWVAPGQPKLTTLRVREAAGEDEITLNIFTMVPATEARNERLNGYRIGNYPRRPFRDLLAYRPPTGFVEVTEDVLSTRLSPHFTLEQFLCKQADGFPKYVALRERLLMKLEYLLALVNAEGYSAETLAILSGFRTPAYNQAIGNVPNSRHLWGGAADIFVDEQPKDGWMDDLNGDGRIDVGDSRLLYRLFERVAGSPEHREFIGGLGVYGATSAHGPFVHVDARGYKARWGKL